MIIFDLDGTLADCEHRRHFIQAPEDHCSKCYAFLAAKRALQEPDYVCECGRSPGTWRCDWKAFYEACDKDKPIEPVINVFDRLNEKEIIQIWSGRCESVREKTIRWIQTNIHNDNEGISYIDRHLKMRPIGDSTPDDVLKERWLDEYMMIKIKKGRSFGENFINFVVDDRPKVVRMWRRRGIFVFDVNQTGNEF